MLAKKVFAFAVGFLFLPISVIAESDSGPTNLGSAFVDEYMRLYGLDEDAALARFEAETVANDIYTVIRSLDIPEYGGAWFDQESGSLVVALAGAVEVPAIDALGVRSVQVDLTLEELNSLQSEVFNLILDLPSEILSEVWVYTDPTVNSVVVGVSENSASQAIALLEERFASSPIVTRLEASEIRLSSTIRGAVGTRNVAFGLSPCSTGVMTQDGYFTGGHCGFTGNQIETPTGNKLGVVAGHIWPSLDVAYVDTFPVPWILSSTIQGYSDGILSVPAIWSGTQESALFTTVCRYGQTSGGPFCGTTDTKGFSAWTGSGFTNNMTRLTGACTEPGDSGGPYRAPSGQIQGTNVGSSALAPCPSSPGYQVFQPISDHIATFPSQNMLTAHAASSPTMSGLSFSFGGFGNYFCWANSYNSQGWTNTFINATTGASSSGLGLNVSCTSGQFVTVTAWATNPYGTGSSSTSFTCSGGPPS
jgi:hypothetical protein